MSNPVSYRHPGHLPCHTASRRYSMQWDETSYFSKYNEKIAASWYPSPYKSPLKNVLSAPSSHSFSKHSCPMQQPPPHAMPGQHSYAQQNSPRSFGSPEIAQPMEAAVERSRYKTELCRSYEETGQCKYNAKCQFAHGEEELRPVKRHPKYKTEKCKPFHATAICNYGAKCTFIHDERELCESSPQKSAASTPVKQSSMKLPITAPLTITSSGESPDSSITSGSPSQNTPVLSEENFVARLSPTPSFGSDAASHASTYSPPPSPKCELHFNASSPLDMGLDVTLFSKLCL